jgi:hypothetical protein
MNLVVNNTDGFGSRLLKPDILEFIKKWSAMPEDGEIIRYTGWIKEKIKS